ncbi:two-component system sensor histidine kinase YesM [Paenibacillus sp. BK033]|uniref:cache domain-containing sensor histidine kinase n=1 Tax=Paenibacillus sp. BK033 TaxID=2512133 RepID=UPI0010528418|nr:sensor histidine kinase [Paenibacillus sp. BK033]TCN01253.1 two-component system sensor histidine kinase YesM [Paenibacillus sp. BK033]
MLASLKSMKLKKQLLLLILISILFMFILEVFYYFAISTIIQSRSEKYADNLLTQLVERIETSNQNVKKATELLSFNKYTQLFLDSDEAAMKQTYSEILAGITPYFVQSNEQVSNIILVDMDGIKSSDHRYPTTLLDHIEVQYALYDKTRNTHAFTDIVKDPVTDTYYYGYVQSVYWSQENTNPFDKIGTCIVQLSTEKLDSFLHGLNMTKGTKFLILDASNRIVSSNDGSFKTGAKVSDQLISLVNSPSKQSRFRESGVSNLLQAKTINETNWKVVSMIPTHEISDDLKPVRVTGMVLVLLFLLLSVFFGAVFNRNITRPITTLIRFLNRIELHKPTQRLQTNERNEFGELYVHINMMLDEIDKMTHEVINTQSSLYEMKLAKKQAELSALISQINPHFMYNTLDCIKGIGYAYNAKEIVLVTESLSNILRYSIKGAEVVYVREELACVRNYLSIISTRFGNRFEFEWEIDEPIESLRMTKFILQPVVENAIYHGLEPKLEKGYLKIRGYMQEKRLFFEITDNGIGIEEGKFEALVEQLSQGAALGLPGSDNRGIGLLNINDRIRHLHGPGFGLHIQSVSNQGTTVLITLPILSD